jgi:hypothetical protein
MAQLSTLGIAAERFAWPFGHMQKFIRPARTRAADMAVLAVSIFPVFPQSEHRWFSEI